MKKLTESGSTHIIEATTAQDLVRCLRPFTFNGGDAEMETRDGCAEASPWPLIKKITTRMSSSVLSDGMVIMDLPGVGDVNKVRSRTVTKALQACTHYIVVGPISRARDNETIEKYFVEGYTRKGSGRVIAAFTHSDQIGDGEDMVEGTPVDYDRVWALQDMAKKLRQELKQVTATMKAAPREAKLELFESQREIE